VLLLVGDGGVIRDTPNPLLIAGSHASNVGSESDR
jgi:hypothetical protein